MALLFSDRERLLASNQLDGRACRGRLQPGVGGRPACGTSPTAWRRTRDTTLAAIFGPQHGFRSDVQDNMIETGHAHDEVRRVPVYSLYSETREPTRGDARAISTCS